MQQNIAFFNTLWIKKESILVKLNSIQLQKKDEFIQTLEQTLLLSRLVNTEEEKFLAVDYNYNYDRSINGLDATKLDQDAFNLVEKIASENQVFQPAIWHLSAAYFNIVKGNFAITKKHLEMASKDTSDRLFRDQWHIINLLYEINNAGAFFNWPTL